MDVCETKISQMIGKFNGMQTDKNMMINTDEVQREESTGGLGAGATKDLMDKIQRIAHSLDELKKSYFKKVKEIDVQLGQKATKEQISALA